MERLVEGAREPSCFLQWQREMREKDLQEELTKIERRHLEGQISHKEAAIARARLMERNQETAQLKKEEVGEVHCTTAWRRHLEKIKRHFRACNDKGNQTKAWLFYTCTLTRKNVLFCCRQLSWCGDMPRRGCRRRKKWETWCNKWQRATRTQRRLKRSCRNSRKV